MECNITTRSSFIFSPPASSSIILRAISLIGRTRKIHSLDSCTVSALKASTPPGSELEEGDILQSFLKERYFNGDFISKASDFIWKREVLMFAEENPDMSMSNPQQAMEVVKPESDDGFLKLAKTQEWVLGINSVPTNPKTVTAEFEDNSNKRKKLNLLKYDALKREMQLMSVCIGSACSVYCLFSFSAQAAASYAIGVALSCLYFHLLCEHTDGLTNEAVPDIFKRKKPKKIGIRSEDLERVLEKSIRGSALALSSPRLVIPAAIFGISILSKGLLDFQLVPAVVGLFAYKAAALAQVYRDNKDLLFIFPEETD